MGYMHDKDGKPNLQYLLPDGITTRTELIKKILIDSIVPKLEFANNIRISRFRQEIKLNANSKYIVDNSKPISYSLYDGIYNFSKISTSISSLQIPDVGGTPIFGVVSSIIKNNKKSAFNIIILSDGDANDQEQFDVELLKLINNLNSQIKIYFIGIGQDKVAEIKSKNLADKTGGFYVNLDILNYHENMFDSMLFEWSTTITSNALKANLQISTPLAKTEPIIAISDVIEETVIEVKDIKIKEIAIHETKLETDSNEIEKQTIDEIEPSALKTQVEENTKSLKLITSQLDSIVKEISFIRKGKPTEDDEFTANEDETYNRAIGYKCEKHLFTQLLKKVWKDTNWLNEVEEQSKPYDFEIFVKGVKYFIECKGSVNSSEEFFLTKNEWQFYLKNRKNYRLYFVSEINSDSPVIIKIEDLITSMEKGELIPCSSVNRKVKADRILFQINQ
jgi:hypothetical protein